MRVHKSILEKDKSSAEYFQTADSWSDPFPSADELSPEVVHWANTTDIAAYFKTTQTKFSDLIVKCKIGFHEVPCSQPQISFLYSFGFCYTMSGTANTAYNISEPGFSSAFSLEIDIQQHEYGSTLGPGAGIWVYVFIYLKVTQTLIIVITLSKQMIQSLRAE